MHHTKISYEETAGVEHTNQQSQKKTNRHNLLIKVTNWGKKEVYIPHGNDHLIDKQNPGYCPPVLMGLR
jgi:hypothetical protein